MRETHSVGDCPLSESFDIIIVGAGIVGAACAEACAEAGHKVLVLDRGPVGAGSTGAAMGHIVVMDDSAEQLALTHYSRRLWNERATELPADVEYQQCGTLWVAADEEEMRAVRGKVAVFQKEGIQAEAVDAAELHTLEPALNSELVGGLLVPEDAVLYPPTAARFLLEQAQARGTALRLGVTVQTLLPGGGVTLSDGETLSAGLVVNAAGCAAPLLSAGLPVQRRKGHLLITDRYPGTVRHQLVELGYLKSASGVVTDSVAFNVQPRANGQLLIGSSRQYGNESRAIDPDILQRMLKRARRYLPELGRLSAIRTWVGFRPATPDKQPFIGPSLASDRIWLATGHEGLGVTTSLATARIIVDLIAGRRPDIPAEPYLPARLANGEGTHA
ncbi:MAG: FAD-binding oxidoreductase [Planctomycetes bacterium]|nr:FAD-binding oxidoreductase [Planctomycetota bacterium]